MRSQITMEFVDIVPQHDLPLYVSLSLLSTMAVGLRLIARIKTKNTLRGDDWSACLGLVLLQAFLGPSIWGNFFVPVNFILSKPSSSSDEEVGSPAGREWPAERGIVFCGRGESLHSMISTTRSSPSQRITPLPLGNVCRWTDYHFYNHSSED